MKEAANSGGLRQHSADQKCYFSALETVLKVVFSCVPSALTAAIMAKAMPEAIKA
jgi:hypothetical protein